MKTPAHAPILTLALMLLAGAPAPAAPSTVTSDRPVVVTSRATPKYPYLMRRVESTAEVTVSFRVNSKGIVTKPSVRRSNNPEFNAAALAAIKKWTFTPASKNGEVVDTQVEQTFWFSVVDKHQPSMTPRIVAERSAR